MRSLVVALLMVGAVQASVRDDVAALYNPKGLATADKAVPADPAPARSAARWYTLSNGQRVDLSQWKVVLFMQGHCPYCQRFDPLLKSLSEQIGLSVFPYTIDGQGDEAYPTALPAPVAVMQAFFPVPMPIATPTTFLVNVNTLATWPLLQGATDSQAFLTRLDTVFQETVMESNNAQNKQSKDIK
ncbi:type-F conjugative transfer system pilin assembly thiol-disulfide isomerase TrbB (plasmid) [Edwardsiella tarda]|nr:type-F conjugative transfer system pilin assembly thiol-disulfide isomerase TrbB [Edwardsiella tarda]WGE31081.1 type-F conjugative transfer system pilin assembly thiol-disulfide isomerase TrbB [Edwardsiella tarda]